MSDEVFNIAYEAEDLITEEETKIHSELATEYGNLKISVRGIVSRFY